VRIAAFHSVAFAFVPSVVTQLASRHPRLRVDFEVCEPDGPIAGLLAHDLDLVADEQFLGRPIVPDDRLDRELLLDELTGIGFGGRVAGRHGPAVAPWLRGQLDDLVPG